MKAKAPILNPSLVAFEHKRDAYGFAVRPQHVQRYREYANIYKEEEEERSDRWNDFLERQSECAQLPVNGSSADKDTLASGKEANGGSDKAPEGDDLSGGKTGPDDLKESATQEDEVSQTTDSKTHQAQIWTRIRPSLRSIEDMMNDRVKKKISLTRTEEDTGAENLGSVEDAKPTKAGVEEDSEDEFYDLERSEPEPTPEVAPSSDGAGASAPAPTSGAANAAPQESSIPWKTL